jgi:soluble lytic murein transglycosylase-like protein
MSARLETRMPNHAERVALLRKVHHEATRANLAPELVLAVIDTESGFDRFAISTAGARGLMQIMPFWLEEIGRPGDNLFQVATNLRFGCTILRYYIDKENGDLAKGLARYNGSVGSVRYSNRVLDRLRKTWFRQ